MTRPQAMPALRRDRAGAAGVEFAMAGSLILVLLLAVFDVGLLFLDQRGLDSAVSKVARWSALNSSDVTAQSVLSMFQAQTAATLGAANQGCVAYSAPPASYAPCYVAYSFSNGPQPGSVVTITASFAWRPVDALTGLMPMALQSNESITVQH